MLTDSILLNRSISRYLKYAKGFDKIEINGFPVDVKLKNSNCTVIEYLFKATLPNFTNLVRILFEKFPDKNLTFYSLQNSYIDINSSPREYWNYVTKQILLNDRKNGKNNNLENELLFFLYYSNEDNEKDCDEFYKKQNSTDGQFCHSLLLRDFLRKHHLGIEIDLSKQLCEIKTDGKKEISKYLGEKLSYLIREKKNELNTITPIHILKEFNKYFQLRNGKEFKVENFIKYITDFYAFNINCEAFNGENDLIINDVKLSDIKSKSGHDIYSSFLQLVKDNSGKISSVSKWLVYVNFLSDLTKLLVYSKETDKKYKILVIDDRTDKIKNELDFIKLFLGNQSIVVKKYLNSACQIKSFFERFDKKRISKALTCYDFILMDLDFEGELKGFDYLKILREITELYDKPFIIVFSRIEDTESIQKALNMGALIYATKQNVAKLILEIYKVLPLINKISQINEEEKYSLGDNWNLLYQLPLTKILELKTSKIIGSKYLHYDKNNEVDLNKKEINKLYGFDEKELECDEDYLWIKKLPKAELHNHIGSVLGPELIPKTALIVLSKWYSKLFKKDEDNANKIVEIIIKFLKPIVTDPFLWDSEKASKKFKNKKTKRSFIKKEQFKDWFKLKKYFVIDENSQFYDQSILTIITDSLNLKGLNKTPEEVLLSPQDQTIEKHFKPFSKIKNSDYLKQKIELRENGVDYDVIMLFFILLLSLRQNGRKKQGNLLNEIKNEIIGVLNEVKNDENKSLIFKDDQEKNNFENEIDNFIEFLNEKISNPKIIFYYKEEDNYLLKNLISAHSVERCLQYKNRGLFNYLRGCEYGGSPHLQCKESIYLVAHHIVNNYAIPDNIRYLDLRCAVDGYNNLKLFDMENKDSKQNDENIYNKIVKHLTDAFSYFQQEAYTKKYKKVHINLIITAKRHKSDKDFEKNVKITLDNYGNKMYHSSKKDEKKYQSFFKDNKTEIVSFDVAGLEKGFRLIRFKDQIRPLLDRCIPITMHAGEEDSHEAIWEAIYLGHAQRLGHALTLKDNENLLKLVRETFINVELCPISNYLTNDKFQFDKEGLIENYPLKKYLKDRVSISINTDNPYVSDSTLSKEFLFASKISGGLTKWQILKIILYSFKSITIDKRAKTRLMREIDEEIFELLLNEGE